jgi:TolA-binding protein
MQLRFPDKLAFALVGLTICSGAQAAFFEDDEARKAILDLRQRVELIRAEVDQVRKSVTDENIPVTKGLFELQRQIELLRGEIAAMRGAGEQTTKDLADIQRNQKDQFQTLSDRISKLEPIKVNVDGVDFVADPAEKRAYESALAVFKKGDFATSQNLFAGFIGRYPGSAYVTPAFVLAGQRTIRNARLQRGDCELSSIDRQKPGQHPCARSGAVDRELSVGAQGCQGCQENTG